MGVPIIGIVKEEELTGVAPEQMRGLADFERTYFCGPLYLTDEARTLYGYLGSRPIFTWGTLGSALLNPLKFRRELKQMGERMKLKGLEGNMIGDGLVKGGVLCIDPDGELRYTFYEDAGKGIPQPCLDKIVAAVRSFGDTAARATDDAVGVVKPTNGMVESGMESSSVAGSDDRAAPPA